MRLLLRNSSPNLVPSYAGIGHLDDFVSTSEMLQKGLSKVKAMASEISAPKGVNIKGPKVSGKGVEEGAEKAVKVVSEGPGQSINGGRNSKFQEIFDSADNYTLNDNTFINHILDRHGPNSTYANKSHFNSDFDIKTGIDSTLKGNKFVLKPNTSGREGCIFEQTFSNPIGTSNNGKALNTLKVVIDKTGNLITAFPKK
jgi:hypothetical protein